MRRKGFGPVVINGHTLTQKDYEKAVINTLQQNGNKWMTCEEMIEFASSKEWIDGKNYPRLAQAHPLYKILSDMMEGGNRVIERFKNIDGDWTYRLNSNFMNEQNVIWVNGRRLVRVKAC